MNPPGLLVSAPASGTGKTTVMLGLLRAIRDEGLSVQPFKSGPDYIDPAFHLAAAGRASFNIDTWAMDGDLIAAVSGQSAGADIIVAEGSMGLYDGVATRGQSGFGSSAETARTMGWPVVLVIDVGGQAQSAAATALADATWTIDGVEAALRAMLEANELSPRKGLQPIRVAVSGSNVSPPLFETLAAMSRDVVLDRIMAAAERAAAEAE